MYDMSTRVDRNELRNGIAYATSLPEDAFYNAVGVAQLEEELLKRGEPLATYTLGDSVRNLAQYGLSKYLEDDSTRIAFNKAKAIGMVAVYQGNALAAWPNGKRVQLRFPTSHVADYQAVNAIESIGAHSQSEFGDPKYLTATHILVGLIRKGFDDYASEQLPSAERQSILKTLRERRQATLPHLG